MAWFTRFFEFIARSAMAAVFIQAGMNKFLHWDATYAYMMSEGIMQYTTLLLIGAGCLEIVAGLCLALGYHQRIAASLLALFLIPTTFLFHHFWNIQESMLYQTQMIHFMKNLAIFGGLLFTATKEPAAK